MLGFPVIRKRMNSVAKIAVGILAAIGAVYVGTMILALIVDPCDSQYLVALDSPDQERKAIIKLRSCSDKPTTELNVVVMQRDRMDVQHVAVLARNPATTEIYLEWSADRALGLRYPPSLKIDNKPTSLADVELNFELIER